MRRIVVGISGASGSIYGYRALEALHHTQCETHLVLTRQACRTIELETDKTVHDFEMLAHSVYHDDDLAASISSGSFITEGMLVIPCSIKSAASIAYSLNANLLARGFASAMKAVRAE